jgi:hypothetical protein
MEDKEGPCKMNILRTNMVENASRKVMEPDRTD